MTQKILVKQNSSYNTYICCGKFIMQTTIYALVSVPSGKDFTDISLQNSEYIISTTTSATERARETKKKDKYVKQLNELRPYYQVLSHIALQRIPMDLDDGVKKSYQLFQGVEVSTEGKKKQTINLLSKI